MQAIRVLGARRTRKHIAGTLTFVFVYVCARAVGLMGADFMAVAATRKIEFVYTNENDRSESAGSSREKQTRKAIQCLTEFVQHFI